MTMNTRLLSELFILSLCLVVSFSARSRSRNPAVSDPQGDNNNAQRRQQHFQPPPPPTQLSPARRTDSLSRLGNQWPSSGDDGGDDEDIDLDQSGDGMNPEYGDDDDDNEGGDVEVDEEEDEIDDNYGENEFGSGDGDEPEDVPTVTRGPLLTYCQNASNRPSFPGAFRPQCTASGAFMPMQCHNLTGECWCVDSDGNQLGNVYRSPMKPNCSPDRGDRTPAPTVPEDFGIDDPKTSVQPSADIRSPNDDDEGENPGVEPVPPKTWYEYILHHPFLLTAVIAGSVLFLVILILMLMFCVYRMRKKDEGSYSLDEPRQTFNYTRAKDQEFFA